MLQRWRALIPHLLLTGLVATLAACSGATTISVVATATATRGITTPTATGTVIFGTATPIGGGGTPTGATTCAQVFPGAATASVGPNFSDLPLPANSVSTPLVATHGGGDGEFTIDELDLCTANSGAHGILTAFANTLPMHGWIQSNWFPVDSEAESPCGDSFCWAHDTRYVKLEGATDLGNSLVKYHLRLAVPPPAPTCTDGYNGAAFPSGYDYFLSQQPLYPGITDGFDHIAYPPLTKQASDTAAGNIYVALCSAGSASMVKTFLDTHLQAVGWVAQGGGAYKYANKFTLNIESSSDPQIKAILHYANPQNYG